MDRGTAMLAVVLDVYEGGKHLIPGWKLAHFGDRDHPDRSFVITPIGGS